MVCVTPPTWQSVHIMTDTSACGHFSCNFEGKNPLLPQDIPSIVPERLPHELRLALREARGRRQRPHPSRRGAGGSPGPPRTPRSPPRSMRRARRSFHPHHHMIDTNQSTTQSETQINAKRRLRAPVPPSRTAAPSVSVSVSVSLGPNAGNQPSFLLFFCGRKKFHISE